MFILRFLFKSVILWIVSRLLGRFLPLLKRIFVLFRG